MTTIDGRESPGAAPARWAPDDEEASDDTRAAHANLFSDDTMPALVELLTLEEFRSPRDESGRQRPATHNRRHTRVMSSFEYEMYRYAKMRQFIERELDSGEDSEDETRQDDDDDDDQSKQRERRRRQEAYLAEQRAQRSKTTGGPREPRQPDDDMTVVAPSETWHLDIDFDKPAPPEESIIIARTTPSSLGPYTKPHTRGHGHTMSHGRSVSRQLDATAPRTHHHQHRRASTCSQQLLTASFQENSKAAGHWLATPSPPQGHSRTPSRQLATPSPHSLYGYGHITPPLSSHNLNEIKYQTDRSYNRRESARMSSYQLSSPHQQTTGYFDAGHSSTPYASGIGSSSRLSLPLLSTPRRQTERPQTSGGLVSQISGLESPSPWNKSRDKPDLFGLPVNPPRFYGRPSSPAPTQHVFVGSYDPVPFQYQQPQFNTGAITPPTRSYDAGMPPQPAKEKSPKKGILASARSIFKVHKNRS